MDFSKVVSQEEVEKIAQRIWEESQEKIIQNISYGIQQDLSMRTRTILSNLMAKELAPLVNKIVAEKAALIQARLDFVASRVVDKAVEQFHSKMGYEVQQALSRSVSEPLQAIGGRLSNLMWTVAKEVIEKEQQALYDEQARRVAEAKAKREAEAAKDQPS